MNIAWISKIEWRFPHKTSRLKMSEALRKRGHDVTLYMVKKFGEKNPGLSYITCIPTIHLPLLSGIFYGLIVFFYFPILLKKKNVDVIIIDCTKVWLPFTIPLKILNKVIILDIRTLTIDKDPSLPFKISMFLSHFLVDGITTITSELKKTLRDIFNLKNMKIGVWSSGVSIRDFDKVIIEKKSLIPADLINNKFIVLYHGDYSPTRGIEELITAISKLESTLKNNIQLLIVGMPKTIVNHLKKLIEELGVKDQIIIISKVSYRTIAQYLKIADVGVIPLPPENKWWIVSAPLKTLECLAASTPIIATNIPFHNEIFQKGNCGILLESGSPVAIAKGISEIYKNKKELEQMGKQGRKIVENFYTWDIMAIKFEKFIKEL